MTENIKGAEQTLPSPSPAGASYRVLARKYRPLSFADMIGQDVLVRTLSNAIASGRIAHAFMLTGVRGVGKTTTARILARALNCLGEGGNGGPTISPCGLCANCKAILADRHPDILEMDAASRTGVADIRELIDGVRYAPVSARYKVYIIDEVHMLSTNAFNALLKTLEEPPPHVKFIFATTEIRKVPITVLSRCQRFDLRRVEIDHLARHLTGIAKAEGVALEEDAARILARAAEGSVRDGISLLDQAISFGGSIIDEMALRQSLGLADRTQLLTLYEHVLTGAIEKALTVFADLYAQGADPLTQLQDLAEMTHWVTRLKIAPGTSEKSGLPESEQAWARRIADQLSLPQLARLWQMLLKGIGEVQSAAHPMMAAEMVLIRMAYLADAPTPAELLERLESKTAAETASRQDSRVAADSRPDAATTSPGQQPSDLRASAFQGPGARDSSAMPRATSGATAQPRTTALNISGGSSNARSTPPHSSPPSRPNPSVSEREETGRKLASPASLEELLALLDREREGILAAYVRCYMRPVSFTSSCIIYSEAPGAPADGRSRLTRWLNQRTGQNWELRIEEGGRPSLAEDAQARDKADRSRLETHPLVMAVMAAFPGAIMGPITKKCSQASEKDRDIVPPAPFLAGETWMDLPAPEEGWETEYRED